MNLPDYAANLVPLAMRLVATVHDEGPQEVAGVLAAIRALEPPPGTDPHAALAVILAAAIDPARTTEELLGWTRPLGGPIAPERVPTGPAANALAREMALAGVLPASALARDELVDVIDHLVDVRGWSFEAIAAHLDTEPQKVTRIRHNSTRRRARAAREAAA